jgi:hypothetical protein
MFEPNVVVGVIVGVLVSKAAEHDQLSSKFQNLFSSSMAVGQNKLECFSQGILTEGVDSVQLTTLFKSVAFENANIIYFLQNSYLY